VVSRLANSMFFISEYPKFIPLTPLLQKKLVDLVGAMGAEKSGSLLVMQQSLRPLVHVNFSVPGLEAAWGLRHASGPHQRFLLLSRADSTLILESGESLQEITNTAEFITNAPTIAAASVLKETYFVQVHPKGVLLMDGRTTHP